MLHLLASILTSLITPAGILIALLVAALVLRRLWREKFAWRVVYVATAIMAAIWFTPIDVWSMRPLENRFPLPSAPACVDGIVVLGGGEDTAVYQGERLLQLANRPMRYVVLKDLMQQFPTARVVFTGGNGAAPDDPYGNTESTVARSIMDRLGIDTGRVLFESKSKTTWENAREAFKLVQPQPEERWILVAAASQMPRAVGAFRQVGWQVLPWPTDFTTATESWFRLGTIGPLVRLSEAEHEWVGLVTYWVTGRSNELFPGPVATLWGGASCPG